MNMFADIANESLLEHLIEKIKKLTPPGAHNAMYNLGYANLKKEVIKILKDEMKNIG